MKKDLIEKSLKKTEEKQRPIRLHVDITSYKN